MEKVQQKGLARYISVCHVTIKKLKDMSNYARIMPVVCKVEMNPMLRQDELLDYCKVEGIYVTALAPIGSFDTAYPYHHTRLSPKFSPLQNETAQAIATAQVRWALQRGTSVVVKPSVDLSYSMREVLDVFDWELSNILESQKEYVKREEYVTKNGNSH
jgi:diketogulonate reductase-like aldo/keto reductase